MTDREMLEFAARAAGMTLVIDPHGKFRDKTGAHPATSVFSLPLWNPLRDPGDALRLAVQMRIDLTHFTDFVRADFYAGTEQMKDVYAEYGTDPLAATMRAITRAAASMGKNM